MSILNGFRLKNEPNLEMTKGDFQMSNDNVEEKGDAAKGGR